MMDTGLQGKLAVITGGASGIGWATAQALAREGCRIVLLDRTALPGNALQELGATEAVLIPVDLTVPTAVENAFAQVVYDHGVPDVLVLSAGIYDTSPLEAVGLDTWDEIQAVNVRAVFLLAKLAIPVMKNGRIITLTSISVETGGAAASPAYVASKAAIYGLTRSMAISAATHGTTVNAVSPGPIASPMLGDLSEHLMDSLVIKTPLQRIGLPEDVAKVICCIASDAFSFVTGQIIPVNGGLDFR